MWAYFRPLVQKIRIWAVMKSMDIISLEMDNMTPKTPDNMNSITLNVL